MTCIATSLTAYTNHLSDPTVSTAGKEPTRAPCLQNGGKYAEIVYLDIVYRAMPTEARGLCERLITLVSLSLVQLTNVTVAMKKRAVSCLSSCGSCHIHPEKSIISATSNPKIKILRIDNISLRSLNLIYATIDVP